MAQSLSITELERELAQAAADRDAARTELATALAAHEVERREARRHLRNMLALVRSIARRTAEQAETGDELRALLDGRLAAFTRGQSALASAPGAGLDFGTLIGDELLSFGLAEGQGVRLDGEPVRLTARAASLLALGIHEIVADLALRGDAPSAEPLLTISWRDEGPDLLVEWCENDRAASRRQPAAWAEWLLQAIRYELKGRVAGRPGCWTLRLPTTNALVARAAGL